MLFIDFQKAFDSVEWEFVLRSLEIFSFGPDFLRWVRSFWKNIPSCAMNNGMTSGFVTLERGVRPGDPLLAWFYWGETRAKRAAKSRQAWFFSRGFAA